MEAETRDPPRITPLEAPYAEGVQRGFDAVMRGAAPLALFRTVGRNPRVLSRMIAGGLLDKGSVSIRQRELVILRTTARCGAEYEWGVHVAAFGAKAGFAPAHIAATVHGNADDSAWTEQERLIVRLVDALHEHSDIDDALWVTLAKAFTEEQRIELIMLAGLYHAVSFVARGTRVPLEPFAPRFPPRA